MKKYSYWIDSGKYSMLQKVLVLILGVLTFMLLTRMFVPQTLGVWGLFLIISGIVETSRNALIRNGYVYFSHTVPDDRLPGINSGALLTNLLFSGIVIILFLGLGREAEKVFNAPGLSIVLYYYCLSLIALVFFSQLEIFLVSKLDFKGIFWMYLARNGSLFIFLSILFVFKYNLSINTLSIAYFICAAMGAIIGSLYLRKYSKRVYHWDKEMFYKFINYGKYVYGNNVSSLIFRNTDSFMTSSYISAAASAFYSSCTRITNFADMPSQVLGDIMFPKAAQIMRKGNEAEIKNLYEKTVAATLTFTLPVIITVLLFSPQILLILAGKQYVAASGLLRIIILYGLFLPFIRQFGNVMDVTNRTHINFLTIFSFAVINIVLNIISIRIFGLPGSAYATLSSYFLLFCTAYFLLWRILKVSLANVVRNVFSLYLEYLKMIRALVFKFYSKNGK
jgi:lipopolysaccharide exporter